MQGHNKNQRSYEHTVASVWALGDLSEESFKLLVVIALLHPDRIQPELFFSNMDSRTLLALEILGYPREQNGYHDARLKLLEACMIHYVGIPDSDECLRVDILVQDVTILRAMQVCDFPEIFSKVVGMVSRIWPHIYASPSGTVGRAHHKDRWPACETAYPHILHLYEQYRNLPLAKKLPIDAQIAFSRLLLEAGW